MNITELTTFKEFEALLIARVGALEIAADTPAESHKPSSSPTSKVIKTHHSSGSGVRAGNLVTSSAGEG